MTFIEAVNQLSLTAAFTIVGSLVTIVSGLLAVFWKVHGDKSNKTFGDASQDQQLIKLSDNIDTLKECVAKAETERKLALQKVESVQKQLDAHERRAHSHFEKIEKKLDAEEDRTQRNFEHIGQKFDDMHAILLKILSDEKF